MEFRDTLPHQFANGNYIAIPPTLLHTQVTIEIKQRGIPVSISGELKEITSTTLVIDEASYERKYIYGIKPCE